MSCEVIQNYHVMPLGNCNTWCYLELSHEVIGNNHVRSLEQKYLSRILWKQECVSRYSEWFYKQNVILSAVWVETTGK